MEIIYEDRDFVVVNKESGILSVPGIIDKHCITELVKAKYPNCIEHPAVH